MHTIRDAAFSLGAAREVYIQLRMPRSHWARRVRLHTIRDAAFSLGAASEVCVRSSSGSRGRVLHPSPHAADQSAIAPFIHTYTYLYTMLW